MSKQEATAAAIGGVTASRSFEDALLASADVRMTVQGAIRVVARHVIASAVESQYGEMWEMYPEIGEDDWGRVCEQVERILTDKIRVPSREFDAAYGLLDLRATGRA